MSNEKAEVSEPQSTAVAQTDKLAPLVEKAAAKLATATTAAEFLDVLGHAKAAYDAAKTMERFARAKEAHDNASIIRYFTGADLTVA